MAHHHAAMDAMIASPQTVQTTMLVLPSAPGAEGHGYAKNHNDGVDPDITPNHGGGWGLNRKGVGSEPKRSTN